MRQKFLLIFLLISIVSGCNQQTDNPTTNPINPDPSANPTLPPEPVKADISPKGKATALVKDSISKIKNADNINSVFSDINKVSLSLENMSHGTIVYDFDGIVKAYSIIPSLVGKDLSGIVDTTGKHFIKSSIEQAKSSPTGWYTVSLTNPLTGKIQSLNVYYEVVGNYIVACGFFE